MRKDFGLWLPQRSTLPLFPFLEFYPGHRRRRRLVQGGAAKTEMDRSGGGRGSPAESASAWDGDISPLHTRHGVEERVLTVFGPLRPFYRLGKIGLSFSEVQQI